MEVIENAKRNELFQNVENGDVFYFNDIPYLKLADDTIAVNLRTFCEEDFFEDDKVKIVNAKLIIE